MKQAECRGISLTKELFHAALLIGQPCLFKLITVPLLRHRLLSDGVESLQYTSRSYHKGYYLMTESKSAWNCWWKQLVNQYCITVKLWVLCESIFSPLPLLSIQMEFILGLDISPWWQGVVAPVLFVWHILRYSLCLLFYLSLLCTFLK